MENPLFSGISVSLTDFASSRALRLQGRGIGLILPLESASLGNLIKDSEALRVFRLKKKFFNFNGKNNTRERNSGRLSLIPAFYIITNKKI